MGLDLQDTLGEMPMKDKGSNSRWGEPHTEMHRGRAQTTCTSESVLVRTMERTLAKVAPSRSKNGVAIVLLKWLTLG